MPAIHSPIRTHAPAVMKVNPHSGRGGTPCPPEHSPARTHVLAAQETANAHAPVGRGLAPAATQPGKDTRFNGSDFSISG